MVHHREYPMSQTSERCRLCIVQKNNMKEKILITGGTGLVGQRLTSMLIDEGYEVGILTRGDSREKNGIHYYNWDVKAGTIDEEALKDVLYIINLVGAGVADSKWTEARKKVIIESRTKSTALLYDQVEKHGIQLKAFISASAIGLYGNYAGRDWKT